jgi:hypothetical protein
MRSAEILRPDRAGETVRACVGELDRLLGRLERDRRQHGPENLLLAMRMSFRTPSKTVGCT